MAELADVQNQENEGVINDAPITEGAPQEAIETPVEKLSLRETIEKNFKEASKDERPRDEKGKFTPKAGDTAEVKATAEPKSPAPAKDAQPNEPSKVAGPPPGWSPESKALYATLPDTIKRDLLKREEEVSSGFKKYSDDNKRYQEIEQVLAPARQVYQAAGVRSDAEAIKNLFGWEAAIRRNPAQAIPALARQYGVDLSQFSPQSQAPSDGGQEIPAQLRPVLDQFGSISQKVTSLEGELQRSREERVSQELSAFAKDKPHFEKVRVRMGQLIQAGAVAPTDLEAAYQQAIWADPDIRDALIKEQAEKQAAELVKNQQQRAQSARSAAISPSGRAPSKAPAGGTEKPKGVRGSLAAAIKELQENRA